MLSVDCCNHCQGKINPADLPSRGMSFSELNDSHIWFRGPSWLDGHINISVHETLDIPPECVEKSVIENGERGIGL